jgi:hypothetical protein
MFEGRYDGVVLTKTGGRGAALSVARSPANR